MTILVNNAVSLLDVLFIGESIVEDTYMLSHAAPHHPTVTCSKLHVVTCVSHDTVTWCHICHCHARTLSLTVAN